MNKACLCFLFVSIAAVGAKADGVKCKVADIDSKAEQKSAHLEPKEVKGVIEGLGSSIYDDKFYEKNSVPVKSLRGDAEQFLKEWANNSYPEPVKAARAKVDGQDVIVVSPGHGHWLLFSPDGTEIATLDASSAWSGPKPYDAKKWDISAPPVGPKSRFRKDRIPYILDRIELYSLKEKDRVPFKSLKNDALKAHEADPKVKFYRSRTSVDGHVFDVLVENDGVEPSVYYMDGTLMAHRRYGEQGTEWGKTWWEIPDYSRVPSNRFSESDARFVLDSLYSDTKEKREPFKALKNDALQVHKENPKAQFYRKQVSVSGKPVDILVSDDRVFYADGKLMAYRRHGEQGTEWGKTWWEIKDYSGTPR